MSGMGGTGEHVLGSGMGLSGMWNSEKDKDEQDMG